MVEDDEVAALEVEAVQAVAGAFGVVDVFIDDVGGAFGVGCDSLADLPRRGVSVWFVERFAPGEGWAHCVAWRECLPDGAEFAEKVEQLFGADGVAEVLDKQRSARSVSWTVVLAETSAARRARDLPVHFWGEAATPAHSLASVFGGGGIDLGGMIVARTRGWERWR